MTDPRIEYVGADLTVAGDCRRVVQGRQCVFMCAASTAGAAVIAATPMIQVTPNVVINAHMLEAAYEAGIKKFLWLASTTYRLRRQASGVVRELQSGAIEETSS